MLRFLYKNKRTFKSTTYMTDFPTFFLGAERKKLFCFERSRSIFSALSGGLTFQEIMANKLYQDQCEHPLQGAPSPGAPSRRTDEREGE